MDSDSYDDDEVRDIIPIGNSESSKDLDCDEDMDTSDEDGEDYVPPEYAVDYRNGGALDEDEGNGSCYGEARESDVLPIGNSWSSEDSDHDDHSDLDLSDEDYVPPIHSTVSDDEAFGNEDALDEDDENQESTVYMYGQDRIHLSISGQRFNLDGDGREFLVTGSNNVLSLSGENSRLVVNGENNVIYYNVEGNNEIIAEGSGVRVIAVEENEHEFDQVLTFQSLVHGHGAGAGSRIHVRSRERTTPTAPQVSSSNALNLPVPSSNGPDSSVPPNNVSSSSVAADPQVSDPSVSSSVSRPQTIPSSSGRRTLPGFLERLRQAMRWPRQRRSQEPGSTSNNTPLSLPADSVSSQPTANSASATDAAAGAPETIPSSNPTRKPTEKNLKTLKRPGSASDAGPSKKVKKEENHEATATSNGNRRDAQTSFDGARHGDDDDLDDFDEDEDMQPPLPPQPRDLDDYDEDENEAQPPLPPQPRETLSTRRLLVEEQNRAFEAALRADREKEERKLLLEQEIERKKQKIKAHEEHLQKLKEEARNSLPKEPALESAANSEGGGDSNSYRVITLQLRLPNGNIIRRRFRSTDTLQTLILFTYSHPENSLELDSLGILRRPNEELTLNYPESNPTLEQLGISNSEMLIVRSYEEEQRIADLREKSRVKTTS